MEKYFRTKFCVSIVQEGVLIKYFQLIVKICSKFCSGRTVSPALLLLLSRTCLDLHTNTTGQLASIMADQYQLLEVANMTHPGQHQPGLRVPVAVGHLRQGSGCRFVFDDQKVGGNCPPITFLTDGFSYLLVNMLLRLDPKLII